MRIEFVDNGSDISRQTETAVSIGCSKDRVATARALLETFGSDETIYSWRRIRDEGPKPKFEQMFALTAQSTLPIMEIYELFRSEMGAYICQKGIRPQLNISEEFPDVIEVESYDYHYNELLAWRYRVSCCLKRKPESKTLHVADRPGEACQGSLAASCIKYHPLSEIAILEGARTGILKSKGPEHFQRFVRACINDPTLLTPGIADINESSRIVRRAIRFTVDELLRDTFVRKAADV